MSSEGHVQRQSFSAQMREVIRKRSESLGRDHERRFADVGRLVAETRRARGMSQQELAVLCGTTQSAIARLERGSRPPKLDTLLRIADALDADLVLEMRLRPHEGVELMAVTLRDFISGDEVLTIESQATLGAAARQMWNRSVGAAVVVEDDQIVGIFTERDLLRAIADSRHPDQGQVQSYMTPDPVTLPSHHSPSEAAQIMTARRFRHIPVVDDGELVGIVSIRDLVSAGLQLPSDDAHVGSDFP